MKNILSCMILYTFRDPDDIVVRISNAIEKAKDESADKSEIIAEIYAQVKRILTVGTDFGFNDNLWANYLTYRLMTDENPFTLTCEKLGAGKDGSVNTFAKNDFDCFIKLMKYDFTELEKTLGINCFSVLTDYNAISKPELMYNKSVSERVRDLSKKLLAAKDADEFFDIVTDFYKSYGVGMYGLNKAFRIRDFENSHKVELKPITNMEEVFLSDLVGYELQKKKLWDNTKAFVDGKPCNNVLLFGDSGTGKSTSVKAIVNEFYSEGLRMIEIYKHQFKSLSTVISMIKNRNYRFIIYMDDLSFEEFEIEYKFLKAVIEGGVETKPENVLIYATSNRRHLIKETWDDRNDVKVDNGMHKSDTMEEKLSLVHRFGVTINYSKPSQKEYFAIANELAKKAGITMTEAEINAEANKWELSHGGISGRTARQFIDYLAGLQ
ncbi:MAG: ATP-binding protein [Lachnospiraceae bacterium]|nr:ATP-binding protein [Lachnospiraceae bacterium]